MSDFNGKTLNSHQSHVDARWQQAHDAFRRLSAALLVKSRPGYSLSLLGVTEADAKRYVRTDARTLADRMSRVTRRAARMIADGAL